MISNNLFRTLITNRRSFKHFFLQTLKHHITYLCDLQLHRDNLMLKTTWRAVSAQRKMRTLLKTGLDMTVEEAAQIR